MSVTENLQDPKELQNVVAAQVSASTHTQVQQKEFLPIQTSSLISQRNLQCQFVHLNLHIIHIRNKRYVQLLQMNLPNRIMQQSHKSVAQIQIWNMQTMFLKHQVIATILNNLTLQCLVPSKRSCILKQTCSFQLQVCLSMHDLLVDTRH